MLGHTPLTTRTLPFSLVLNGLAFDFKRGFFLGTFSEVGGGTNNFLKIFVHERLKLQREKTAGSLSTARSQPK